MKIERLFLFLSIALTVFLRAHYTTGLYYDHDIAYYAYQTLTLLSGKELLTFFREVIPPGINFIFASAFMIFGKSFISVQLFSLIFNVSSIILLYLFSKKILSRESRFYYLLPLLFSLFSVSEVIQGHAANLETFLNTFEIAAVLFLGVAAKNKRTFFYAASGFFLGLAFLVKQSAFATFISGIFFIIFIRVIAILKTSVIASLKGEAIPFLRLLRSLRSLAMTPGIIFFITAFIAPFFLIYLYFLAGGHGDGYLNSLFLHALKYNRDMQLSRYVDMAYTLNYLWQNLKFEIVFLGAPALIAIFYTCRKYKRWERTLIVLWFLIPALIISRFGFHYRHHFLEIMPSFLALAVMGIGDIHDLFIRIFKTKIILLRLSGAAGICILLFPFVHGLAPLVKAGGVFDCIFITQRYIHGNSIERERYAEKLSMISYDKERNIQEPYEAVRRFLTAQYIKDNSGKDDKIFVWDDMDSYSVYFWSERQNASEPFSKFIVLPAKLRDSSFFFTEKKWDYKTRQGQIVRDIAEKQPVYIIVVKGPLYMPGYFFTFSELLSLERKEFKGFFSLLDEKYILEKEIMDCLVYKLRQAGE